MDKNRVFAKTAQGREALSQRHAGLRLRAQGEGRAGVRTLAHLTIDYMAMAQK